MCKDVARQGAWWSKASTWAADMRALWWACRGRCRSTLAGGIASCRVVSRAWLSGACGVADGVDSAVVVIDVDSTRSLKPASASEGGAEREREGCAVGSTSAAVTLPRHVEAPRTVAAPRATAHAAGQDSDLSTKRVVFVDDEPANCRLGLRMLAKLGVKRENITTLSNGERPRLRHVEVEVQLEHSRCEPVALV